MDSQKVALLSQEPPSRCCSDLATHLPSIKTTDSKFLLLGAECRSLHVKKSRSQLCLFTYCRRAALAWMNDMASISSCWICYRIGFSVALRKKQFGACCSIIETVAKNTSLGLCISSVYVYINIDLIRPADTCAHVRTLHFIVSAAAGQMKHCLRALSGQPLSSHASLLLSAQSQFRWALILAELKARSIFSILNS